MRTALAQTWWLTHRQLAALVRQPAVVVISLVQPAVWLLLFGALFRRVVELPGFGGGSYLDYLVPGVVVMNAVSVNMWSGMGVIEDIERGVTDRFLVAPVRRGAILTAPLLAGAVSTALQSAVVVLLGMAAGARPPGGAAGTAVLVAVSVLLGAVFTAMSNAMGLTLRQRESIIGFSVFLLLPLTFLSSAFMARDLMPGWIRGVATANPVDWALRASRAALAGDRDWASVLVHGGSLLALAVAAAWLSTLTFRAYQRSA
ncbi:ABC transporter permease [Actinomadura kijaniata]|uniref:ABC transporter permease n=1 Tax=Actinomadura kijaniata TaxID=46161 RepID=UPI003F1D4C52